MAPLENTLLHQQKHETEKRIGHTRGRWDKEVGPQAESIGCMLEQRLWGEGEGQNSAREVKLVRQAVGRQEAIAEALVASDVQL